jgi:homoserine dehydrogenase
MNEIGIGILGFGTVGAGVAEGLIKNGELMANRLGARPVLRKIADLDITTDRGITVDADVLTTDAEGVINDPGIDIVVELIGGTGVALKFVKMALANGKAVVTANKKLLAEYGSELYALATANKADLYFGASVGGGIPIIRALREGLCANRVESISGILNGTCNYILTRMENEGLDFDVVLKDAQELGFAEADPSLDIDGFDTAHKAVILSSLACGHPIALDEVNVEGVRGISKVDIDCALELGYRIKLLAMIKREGARVEVRVGPTLVSLDDMLASVSGVFNAVKVNSDLADATLYYGRGAGRLPTASTVLGDICDIVRNLSQNAPHRMEPIPATGEQVAVTPVAETTSCNYLRLSGAAASGAAAILDKHSIAVESRPSLTAAGDDEQVIVTGAVREADMQSALQEINALDENQQAVRLRIMA